MRAVGFEPGVDVALGAPADGGPAGRACHFSLDPAGYVAKCQRTDACRAACRHLEAERERLGEGDPAGPETPRRAALAARARAVAIYEAKQAARRAADRDATKGTVH